VQTAAATEAQSVRTSAEKWIAGVTALFGLADPPKPLIKVTRADDSEVCGNLLDSTAKSPIRVKKTNGDVVDCICGSEDGQGGREMQCRMTRLQAVVGHVVRRTIAP